MSDRVKKIRLISLHSENDLFDRIDFNSGINLILGEKYDESITYGRKTNGVGKSLCIDFIRFCLLAEYRNSRIEKIPESVFPLTENVVLNFLLGEDKFTIIRNRKEQNTPLILKNGEKNIFDKFEDAKKYLSDIIFFNSKDYKVPSFRSFTTLFMREENSNFESILKTTKAPIIDIIPHLFMFDLSIELLEDTLKLSKQIKDIKINMSTIKNELTENKTRKMNDIKAEINSLDKEVKETEELLDNFKTDEMFKKIENEIIELENTLEMKRTQRKFFETKIERIKIIPNFEKLEDNEIKILYNSLKTNLGDFIVKSLEETVSLKNKIEEFENTIINTEINKLKQDIGKLNYEIENLESTYSEKLSILDKKGTLKSFKTGISELNAKKEKLSKTRNLFENFKKYETKKLSLEEEKAGNIVKINRNLNENQKILSSFNKTVLDYHYKITGSNVSSFDIYLKDKTTNIYDINMRISDDGSHSVNRTKVFIYDVALLFNEFTRQNHPNILIHDNIFDVDQDTLVQCLNFLSLKEGNQNFQYILTLNRDKIENEERKKEFKFDVNSHKIAVFTKKDKFLKKDYQEL